MFSLGKIVENKMRGKPHLVVLDYYTNGKVGGDIGTVQLFVDEIINIIPFSHGCILSLKILGKEKQISVPYNYHELKEIIF